MDLTVRPLKSGLARLVQLSMPKRSVWKGRLPMVAGLTYDVSSTRLVRCLSRVGFLPSPPLVSLAGTQSLKISRVLLMGSPGLPLTRPIPPNGTEFLMACARENLNTAIFALSRRPNSAVCPGKPFG